MSVWICVVAVVAGFIMTKVFDICIGLCNKKLTVEPDSEAVDDGFNLALLPWVIISFILVALYWFLMGMGVIGAFILSSGG